MGEISCEFCVCLTVIGIMCLCACLCSYERTCIWAIGCCHWCCCYRFCVHCHSRWMDGYLSDWSDCCLMLCHTLDWVSASVWAAKTTTAAEKSILAIINSHKFTLSHSILRRIFLSVNIINGQFHHKMWENGDGKWVRERYIWQERTEQFSIYFLACLAMHSIYDAFSSLDVAHSARYTSSSSRESEKKTSNSKLIYISLWKRIYLYPWTKLLVLFSVSPQSHHTQCQCRCPLCVHVLSLCRFNINVDTNINWSAFINDKLPVM